MKSSKPIILLLAGSAMIFFIALIACIMLNYWIKPFPVWVVFVFPLFIGGVAYLVFYTIVKNMIHDRLTILYKSIRRGKSSGEKRKKFRIADDIIGNAEAEAKLWAEERSKEIIMLKQQEAFRREFLGNLAHELKTPIFSIQGYILTLLEGGLEDETVNRKFLERASQGTDRMVRIVEDLDEITKMEVDKLAMNIQKFDIIELIKEIIDSFEIKAKEKNIVVKFNKTYPTVIVKGDRYKIGQVITNLINNSIAYNNENGTTKVRLNQLDKIVTVEIADDGPGIESKDMTRLFERFYRVEKSRNRNEGGSGLGLAIAKHIVEAHGYTLTVRSTVGMGSTFAFSLDAGR